MKKLFLLLFVLGVAFYQADAQSCKKAKTAAEKKECAKKCASKKAKQTKVAAVSAEAILAAEQSEDVEMKTCEVSGKKSFYKKSVCAVSGNEKVVQVQYDNDTKEFVDVASASMEVKLEEAVAPVKAKSCTKAEKKACAKKAKQTKVAAVSAEAILAAEKSENIEVKTCEVSGKKSFYKKSVCAVSGNEKVVQVQYDNDTKEFVDVASASMEVELEEPAAPMKKSCAKKCSKECAKDCCKGKKAEMEKEKS